MKNAQCKYSKLILIALVVLLWSIMPTLVKATEAEEELSEIEEKTEEAKTEMAILIEDLEKKQAELDDINTDIFEYEIIIDQKKTEIENMLDKIGELRSSIVEQKGSLGNRLRNMYKSGAVGMFDILIDSDNYSEFLSNLSMLQKIYDSDQKTLTELEDRHRELEQLLVDLEQAKLQLDAEMAVLEEKQSIAEKAKMEVEADLSEVEDLIAEYDAEAERLAAIIAEEQLEIQRQLEEARRVVEEDDDNGDGEYINEVYQNFSNASDSGFIWPAAGELTSYFGPRPAWDTHGIGSTNHGGIDIANYNGGPIYASRSGYVTIAYEYQGYGNAVAIAHGDGFSTLYGHMSSITVSVGEFVNQGDVIGYMGNTGRSDGVHLHFEVLINGVPVDPLDYL